MRRVNKTLILRLTTRGTALITQYCNQYGGCWEVAFILMVVSVITVICIVLKMSVTSAKEWKFTHWYVLITYVCFMLN